MKQCSKCKKSLDETEFHKRPNRPSGLRSQCRRCERERKRVYRPYKDRPWTKNRVLDPVKVSAQGKVRDAVRHGRLEKPNNCQGCGKNFEKRQLAGHHHRGYEHPLDVMWLCCACHAAEHSFK